MTPPRVARLILRLLLPAAERAVIAGDLDEELRRDIVPSRGLRRARLWYWRQVLASTPHALGLRCLPVMRQVPGDLRQAFRMWRRHPAFALAAISTQATGIAVTTAVMAVAYAVLLRPLPYADADRIVQIFEGTGRPGLLSYQDFVDLRRAARRFEAVAGFSGGSRTVAFAGAAPERVPTVEVTDGFFDVLGVQPVRGRKIRAADIGRGTAPVVMLSHPSWQRRFGGDPAVIGRTILLDTQPHTVVGVLPREFEFPLRGLAEFWLPMRPSPQQEARGYWHWMDVLGRRWANATPAQADAELQGIARTYEARDPKWHGDARLRTEPLREVIVGGVRPTIRALVAAVGLVLIATCATIAGLLLSRGSSRVRELSVRAAIGAGRGRLVRQLLTENVLLSLTGGLAGVLCGHWLLRGFAAVMPRGQRAALPYFEDIGVDAGVAGAAVLLSMLTGLIVGVIPALRVSRADGSGALGSARTTSGPAGSRVRFALVGLQVALALVLLSGAAMLGSSVYRLLQVSPGFETEGLVTMRLTLPGTYPDAAAVHAFQTRLFERLAALPGVTAVAAVNQAPLTGRGNTGALTVVERPRRPGEAPPEVALRMVSGNYFSAMGIPVIRGRAFSAADSPGSPQVVVINRWLADRVLAGADPIGQHITFEFAEGRFQIVGIVGNEQLDAIDKPRLPVVYFAATQDAMRAFTIMARAAQPSSFMAAARSAVAELDPDLPLFSVRTMEQVTAESSAIFVRRAAMWLLGIFACAGVLLAAMGLYGVLAQAVSERTREIGVRLALGATRGRIVGLVLRRGLAATAAGLIGGLVATALASRLLAALLFGVAPGDPVILAASAAFLATVSVLACVVPALRAVRIDPATAVRLD
jgi:predicted permease